MIPGTGFDSRRRAAIARGIRAMRERGVHWADWAEGRGFSRQAVKDVLRRDARPARRGERWRVAEALIEAGHEGGDCQQGVALVHDLKLLAWKMDTRLGKLEAEIAALREAVLRGERASRRPDAESGSFDSVPPRPFLDPDQAGGSQ